MNSTVKKKSIKNENSKLKTLAKEQLFNIIIYALIFIIVSAASLATDISEKDINYLSTGAFTISGLISGYSAGFKSRKDGIVIGLKSVSIPTALIVLISLIINKFDIDILKTIINASIMLLSGVIGSIAGVNTRIKPKTRRK